MFLALGGGAFAATKLAKNSVTSKSVKDSAIQGKDVKDDSLTGADVNEATLQLKASASGPSTPTGPAGGDLTGRYPNPQIAANSVTGDEVKDESLTGADVQESSLGEVPAAALGGIGRYGFDGSCDPETPNFQPCSVAQINLPNPSRVLVIGTARAQSELTTPAFGFCRIGTDLNPVFASTDKIRIDDGDIEENFTVTAVTDVMPAGLRSFGIDCNEGQNIKFLQARVSAVALSADRDAPRRRLRRPWPVAGAPLVVLSAGRSAFAATGVSTDNSRQRREKRNGKDRRQRERHA